MSNSPRTPPFRSAKQTLVLNFYFYVAWARVLSVADFFFLLYFNARIAFLVFSSRKCLQGHDILRRKGQEGAYVLTPLDTFGEVYQVIAF